MKFLLLFILKTDKFNKSLHSFLMAYKKRSDNFMVSCTTTGKSSTKR